MHSSIIPIFLSKLNIAKQGHMVSIKVDYSVITLRLLEMFEELGIIRGYRLLYSENKIFVLLKYSGGSMKFFKLSQVSTSGKRVYVDLFELLKLKENNGNTIFIVFTVFGLLFDYECFSLRVGGEVVVKIVFL